VSSANHETGSPEEDPGLADGANKPREAVLDLLLLLIVALIILSIAGGVFVNPLVLLLLIVVLLLFLGPYRGSRSRL
jgi:hypothetical protein